MVEEIAEVCALEPDTTVEEAVGSWVEMGVAEHDLGMLTDVGSDTEYLVKAVILAGSSVFAYRSSDQMGSCFASSQG